MSLALAALLFTLAVEAPVQAAPPKPDPIRNARVAFEDGDYAAALKVLKPLADKGDPEAMAIVGRMYETGSGLPKDPEAALALYRKASARQSLDGRTQLARAYLEGTLLPFDVERGQKLAKSAAEAGWAPAMTLLGTSYSRGDTGGRDYTQAVFWFEKAAAAGDAEAQYSLGLMYSSGIGLPKQMNNAARWLRMSSEQGNAKAQYLLGLMLSGTGEGVTHDPVEGYTWLSLANRRGVTEARKRMTDLEASLRPGELKKARENAEALKRDIDAVRRGEAKRSVVQKLKPRTPAEDAREAFDSGKYEQARKLAEPLADTGDPEANYLLGLLYERGLGVKKDLDKAMKYTRESAERGYRFAQYNLAVMYETGRPSVQADLVEAYKWYALAASQGDEDALDKLKMIADREPEKAAQGKALAQQWLKDHRKKR